MAHPRLLLLLVAILVSCAAPALAHESGNEDGLDDSRFAATSSDEGDLAVATAPLAEDADPRALTEFRSALDPYGEWYQHPEFGLLWVPSPEAVGNGFVPYLSAGRWALDTHGNWVWQSDYPFGWVVFHYGRWIDVPGIGWAWIPGYLYSPAWVVWGSPNDNIAYVGWAPLGPSFIWMDGVAVVAVGIGSPYWVFCRSHYAFSPWLHLHVVKDEQRREYLRRRTVRRDVVQVAPRPTNKWLTPIARGGSLGASSPAPRGPEVTGERRGETGPDGLRPRAINRDARSARLSSTRPAPARPSPPMRPTPTGNEPLPVSERTQAAVELRRTPAQVDERRFRRRLPSARASSAAGRFEPAPPRRSKARLKPKKIKPQRTSAGLPTVRPRTSD